MGEEDGGPDRGRIYALQGEDGYDAGGFESVDDGEI